MTLKTVTRKLPKYTGKEVVLGVQHLFAMFGATVLVPIVLGLSPSLALFTAGAGTLLFHILTKMKVPVFLGSSFSFMPVVLAYNASGGTPQEAQFGIIVAGAVYGLLALTVFLLGADRTRKLFPPVVTGPITIAIGLMLAPVALNAASGIGTFGAGLSGAESGMSWGIAAFTIAVTLTCMVFLKGFFRLTPILMGITAGYILCVILGLAGVFPMDYSPVSRAAWFNIPYYTEGFMSLPKPALSAALTIAPVAVVTFMEHVGDIITNGKVVGKDFFKDPGLHRTLLGDGVASALAGFFGGPANTTYSENTGVLATTKNYDPRILRLTAVFAIVLGLFGKFGAVLQTIPGPVMGGVEIILFGMIAAIGIRTLAEAKLDFTESSNLIVVALILVCGLGLGSLPDGGIKIGGVLLSPLFIATVLGVGVNLLLTTLRKKEEVVEIPRA